MLIYSAGRTTPNPSLNAVATAMLVVSLAAAGLAIAGKQVLSRRQGLRGIDASGGSALAR